jgi:hypothetical protein
MTEETQYELLHAISKSARILGSCVEQCDFDHAEQLGAVIHEMAAAYLNITAGRDDS